MSINDEPRTLLSSFHPYTDPEKLPNEPLHPFTPPAEKAVAALRELVHTLEDVQHSTEMYLAGPSLSSKTVSLLRQEAVGHDVLHLTSQHVRQTVTAVRERSSILYGTDIPLSKPAIPDWCFSRVQEWGTQAGMEAFPEAESNGRRTMILGGKVLVLDVDFIMHPTVDVAAVKTSYAVPSSGTTGSASASLSGYLEDVLREWLRSVQSEDVTGIKTARLGRKVLESLSYLMKLDRLAEKEGDMGIRWFSDQDALGQKLEGFARTEAQVVAHDLGTKQAPLDILLLRGHALPLPYLTSPSLTFLVYLSPLSYLTLYRTIPTSLPTPSTVLPALSIPFQHLRSSLPTISQTLPGVTLATLRLSPLIASLRSIPNNAADQTEIDLAFLSSASRPTYPLAPAAAGFTHNFPLPEERGWVWVLDFTGHSDIEGQGTGKRKGVVMTQSRMREIQDVVDPLDVMMSNLGAGGMHMGMMGYGLGPSWVDMLLNPEHQGYGQNRVERYTTTYTSPKGLHPPLHIRLDVPDEPGFILEQVQVYTMKEVTAILEIVKEQCWLNSMLESTQWTPENPDQPDLSMHHTDNTESLGQMRDDADDEADLQALLDGTFAPHKIPVSLSLPDSLPSPTHPLIPLPSSSPPLFNTSHRHTSTTSTTPRLRMTFPERPPLSGLIEVEVRYEPGRKRGVGVDVRGAITVDWEGKIGEELEEAVRRGGVFGVPGRVWEKAGGGGVV